MDNSLQKFDNIKFGKSLTAWYESNKRTLPWRQTSDPYKIWVSEIMLQQTKVDTVINYFNNFIAKYPTIFDLASSEEEEVLKQWEGLGYYSRARNLHHAAKEVVSIYNGIVPSDSRSLGDLKGIGPYTKGAILSIAFHQPEPAVDGNVMRVLSRILYITDNISDQRTRKRFENIVRELIIHTDPSAFNQGLMELGALICTPKKPLCLHCPVKEMCRALEVGETDLLPVKLKKKKQRLESYIVLIIKDKQGRIAIEKRPENGLLANMWQFPMLDKELFEQGLMDSEIMNKYQLSLTLGEKKQTIKHVFSHIIWMLDVYHASVAEDANTSLKFAALKELDHYPFSVSHLKIIQELKRNKE